VDRARISAAAATTLGSRALLRQQVRAGDEHGRRVGGVSAREGGFGLPACERAGGARPAVDELHRVVREDGAERRGGERGEHGEAWPRVAAMTIAAHAAPIVGCMYRLARQRADAGRAQHAGAPPGAPAPRSSASSSAWIRAWRVATARAMTLDAGGEGDRREARHRRCVELWKRDHGREYVKQ
jgi:hypothetical protein